MREKYIDKRILIETKICQIYKDEMRCTIEIFKINNIH